MKSYGRVGLGLGATLGLGALLLALGGAAPANADPWDGHGHVYADIQDVRRDERALSDIEYRRDEARRCRRWDEARALDREARDLRRHIDRDRRDIREDIRRDLDRDRYDDRRRDRSDDRRRENWDRDRDRDHRTRYRDDR